MDAIESLDDGANAFFTFQVKKTPQVLQVMEPAYYASSYVSVLGLLAVIVMILLLRHQLRAALAAVLGFIAALCVIQLMQTWVPRARPQEAALFLGRDSIFFFADGANVPSYPAGKVLLFLLGLILLGQALWDWLPRVVRGVYLIAAAILTVWVCIAQFFLALHFVTDVIGAFAAAALIGWIVHLFTRTAPPGREGPIDHASPTAIAAGWPGATPGGR